MGTKQNSFSDVNTIICSTHCCHRLVTLSRPLWPPQGGASSNASGQRRLRRTIALTRTGAMSRHPRTCVDASPLAKYGAILGESDRCGPDSSQLRPAFQESARLSLRSPALRSTPTQLSGNFIFCHRVRKQGPLRKRQDACRVRMRTGEFNRSASAERGGRIRGCRGPVADAPPREGA